MPCVIFVLAVGSVWDAEPGINELKVKVYVCLTGQTTSKARKYGQWGGGGGEGVQCWKRYSLGLPTELRIA